MALRMHLFRTINNFNPASCHQQTLAGGWPLRLAPPVPLPKRVAHPAVVIITMETCPVSAPLLQESTGTPKIYIFHLHVAESCSLRPNCAPSLQAGWHTGAGMIGRAAPLRNWMGKDSQPGDVSASESTRRAPLALTLTEIICSHRCL